MSLSPPILPPVPTFGSPYARAWFADPWAPPEQEKYHENPLRLLRDLLALQAPDFLLPPEDELEKYHHNFPLWEAARSLCIGRNVTREWIIDLAHKLRRIPISQMRHFGNITTWDQMYWLGIRLPGYAPSTPLGVGYLPYTFWRIRFAPNHLPGGSSIVGDQPLWHRFCALYTKYAVSSNPADRELFCGPLVRGYSLMALLDYLNAWGADNEVENGGCAIRHVSEERSYFECELLGLNGKPVMYAGCNLTAEGEYRGWSVNT